MYKSLLDGVRLDMDLLSLVNTASGNVQHSDSKLLHRLIKLMHKVIHGLQNQLARFAATHLETGERPADCNKENCADVSSPSWRLEM